MTQPANNDTFVDVGGYVDAKNKCPHVSDSCQVPENETLAVFAQCLTEPLCTIPDCDKTECWFCLSCHKLFCGRYANNHMSIHCEESHNKTHCIAMGVGDLSFWCYKCDSYINHLTIRNIFEVYKIAHIAKHGENVHSALVKQTRFADQEDLDGDHKMSEYDASISTDDDVDYLDPVAKDTTHETLIAQIENNQQSTIEWDSAANIPNIKPVISNLNHRTLFVGRIGQNTDHQTGALDNPFMPYFSSRSALCTYSLFSNIESKLKLEYIKLCVDKNKHLDRTIACMLGMGIGDSVGAPLEFIPCVNQYNKSYFTLKGAKKWINEQNAFSLKRGQWTDDASMGLCIADSLIIHRQYKGSDIRIRFWNWWNNGYNNAFRLDANNESRSSVGLGGNISKSIYSMMDNKTPTPQYISSSNKDDSGNGSIMRLAPIPLFFSHCIQSKQMMDVAVEYAKQSSFSTHPGYIAAECCALMTYIIINAIHRDKNETDDEEKKENHDDKDVKMFLENITNKYLKDIEIQHAELKETLQELVKSKQFNYVKDKVQELSLKKDKKKSEKGNDSEDMRSAWSKIQTKLNHIHRQIMAKKYIMRLIKSEEADDSTERCWNWKEKYGELGIDKTMINRGSDYNGYPNTQGYFGSYCMDGLAMGLHSVYNSTSFGDAIKKAVNMLGDADSTGSIAGQLAGSWYGFKDVFYNKNGEQFLFKQISKWDDYEFGLRAILLYSIGADFAKKLSVELKAKKAESTQSK